MTRKFSLLFVLLAVFVGNAFSNPVSWNFSIADKGKGEIDLVATASVQKGWHIYDVKINGAGPNPTTLKADVLQGAAKSGSFKATRGAKVVMDESFGIKVGLFDGTVSFVQRYKVTDKSKFKLEGSVRVQACNDETCTPHVPTTFKFSASDLPASVINAPEEKADTIKTETPIVATDTASVAQVDVVEPLAGGSDLWTPVIDELKIYGAVGDVSGRSLLMIFIIGFGGGLIALLTPCVWPMIPMTVSFFLKRNKKNRAKAIKDAIIYGLAIIFIYVVAGLLITAIFGASALNDLSTTAWFNVLMFLLLVVFAASFFGAFEITLPSSWTTKLDNKADSTTGFLSMLFMAATLALVSFSCTGPIIGTLLVDAASSGAILAPALGMFGFALALAIPFALFAIFPTLLESMPKSGGWMVSVKVVLGFLELAFALKFLSVADQAYGWGILDREVFLVLWIIIFVMLGFYLLGKIKFEQDDTLHSVTVPRLFMAMISLSFALYMVPGLWGAPLKSISAFTPLMKTQDFNLYDGAVHAKFDDYEEGMEYARKNNKPVLLDFSGYGCVNCREMEQSVWIDARVKNILENDYVLITLMVDDKRELPTPEIKKEANGTEVKLETIGDKWSYLQRHKFGTNSQPYYVPLNAEGKPISSSYAYNKNVDKYLEFLMKGLDNFDKTNLSVE